MLNCEFFATFLFVYNYTEKYLLNVCFKTKHRVVQSE